MSDAAASIPFDDGKAVDAMRTIGEIAAGFGIKQHILRYWEQQFPMLRPLKRSGGRRLYRPEDVALIAQIDQLINRDGYTLKGARQVIEGGRKPAAPATHVEPQTGQETGAINGQAAGADASAEMLAKLKNIRQRLSAALENA